METEKGIVINPEQCNRDIRTYGDVIRHMTNSELALFLRNMGADIELGTLAILRAKSYPHRVGGDKQMDTKNYEYMYSFMSHRIADEDDDFADVWGVESWHDLCQWEWPNIKKNFGSDVVY